MNRQPEPQSAAVPQAPQAEVSLARWSWVTSGVWTIRMLTTLEQGVRGGKWFRLFDKVYSERNLSAAFQQVAANKGAPGVDHVTIREFERRLPENLGRLADQLRQRSFRPQAIRRVHIEKPGTKETRPLGIPTVRDRTVQAAIANAIEPIFERDFAEQSYGFRPKRGCKDALRRVAGLLKAGYHYVVDADLKAYFDTIPHDRLMDRLREKIADGPVLNLIEAFLKAEILEELSQWTPEKGAPQGAVLSPLLSNIYLDPLDHLMARSGYQMVRYADDFVILCRTAEEAQQALELVRTWVADNQLILHPTKTKVVDVRTEGFDFLGYHFIGAKHWPRKKAIQKIKDSVRRKTKRQSGRSLQAIIADLNQTLRGWFVYFQHSRPWIFSDLDRWTRGRLRSILRKRSKRRGRGRGRDHVRWPNAFFATQGLFSLKTAHVLACQSSRR
jgi:RNA-directed DNA polymerase